ncbi:MAG: SBBP repeat-containing protein, partial [Thermodesulfobacteriota bacterium]
MKTKRILTFLKVAAVCGLAMILLPFGSGPPLPRSHPAADRITLHSPGPKPPSPQDSVLAFEPNLGQAAQPAKFLAHGSGYTLFLAPDRTLLIPHSGRPGAKEGPAPVSIGLAEADSGAKVDGRGLLPGKSNYMRGRDRNAWLAGVPHYQKVVSRDVYPGVDLVQYGNGAELEWDFVVRPGADPGAIRIRVEGNEGSEPDFRIGRSGELNVLLGESSLVLKKPVCYQTTAQGMRPVKGSYVLLAGGKQAGFHLAGWDRDREVVIDPVIAFSSYLGGAGTSEEYGMGVAVDSQRNVYVAGTTASATFPTVNPFQAQLGGNGLRDVFVSKFSADGSTLLYSTYLGGSQTEGPGPPSRVGLAVDKDGYAYVAGTTESSDFPVTEDAFQHDKASGSDAFVTKLSQDGSSLVYSTYLGGGGTDEERGVAVDNQGHAFVLGNTVSSNFPTTEGAFQRGSPSFADFFITKLNAGGTGLVYSTLLGGSQADYAQAIALDSRGRAVVAGETWSGNFPMTAGAVQASIAGNSDAVAAVLSDDGSALVYSTFLGGGATDRAYGAAVNQDGDIFLAGETNSGNFPAQNAPAGGHDAFAARINTALGQATWSRLLGGGGDDYGFALAVDAWNNVYIAGVTASDNFPVQNALQQTRAGWDDAFVTKLTSDGALSYSTYLGGSGSSDRAYGVCVDSAGNAYVTGHALSNNFPTTGGAFQEAGGNDAFLTKIFDPDDPHAPS